MDFNDFISDANNLYPRSGHRAVVDSCDMYVLGGYNPRFRDVENSNETYYPLFKEVIFVCIHVHMCIIHVHVCMYSRKPCL